MLRDMFFTLAGWLMFFLGVMLGGYVRGLFSGLGGRLGAGTSRAGG